MDPLKYPGIIPTAMPDPKRLSTPFLLAAYANGYFPMPDETDEIRWYRPDPRAILPLNGFHCSRSLARKIKRKTFEVTYDKGFRDVMKACAARAETWINDEFLRAYGRLHDLGQAHSVEVWSDKKLVGGVYGVQLNGAFFAESKFHTARDASKIALYHLVEHLNEGGFKLLEVQFLTPHLASLGAIEISDREYQQKLKKALLVQASFKCAK